ncbi:MAG: type II secretion system protein M [Pseudomonadota bacterium]|nr:type II secretion system protein M [Pseudomonadota bacterium]
MLVKLKEQPAVARLIAHYDQLPARDRQALLLMTVALVMAILYFGIWRPADAFNESAEAERKQATELLGWMQSNRASLKTLASAGGSGTGPSVTDGRALMALVTKSAGEAGLTLQRFEPSGDSAIRVWMENVAYADVAAWLERLKTAHGVVIDQAAMDRQDEPGIVSVRLTLAI